MKDSKGRIATYKVASENNGVVHTKTLPICKPVLFSVFIHFHVLSMQ